MVKKRSLVIYFIKKNCAKIFALSKIRATDFSINLQTVYITLYVLHKLELILKVNWLSFQLVVEGATRNFSLN